ncbi:hypothetical protein V6N13_114886 [Hibiscus sabdariffa]|uniref:Uncharacterized protein n=1 Tax=Hibiscus sabdariffa TaxID=183260 RepID=A0ABR2U363_9ROSI
MANPKLSDGGFTGITADNRSGLHSSTVNGRPPDAIPLVYSSPVLERPSSPLAADLQSDVKKVRGPEIVNLDETTAAMDVEDDSGRQEVLTKVVEVSPDHGQDPGVTSKSSSVSYANMVGRSLRGVDQLHDGGVLDPNKELCSLDTLPTSNGKSSRQSADNVAKATTKETGTDGLFGPWMVVDTRRRKPQSMKLTSKGREHGINHNSGSRFAILGDGSESPEAEQVSEDMEGVKPINECSGWYDGGDDKLGEDSCWEF